MTDSPGVRDILLQIQHRTARKSCCWAKQKSKRYFDANEVVSDVLRCLPNPNPNTQFDEVIRVLTFACKVQTTALTLLALKGFEKLIVLPQFYQMRYQVQKNNLSEFIDAIHYIDSEQVQACSVKVFTRTVIAYETTIYGASLNAAVRLVFNIAIMAKCPTTQKVARERLKQMVNSLTQQLDTSTNFTIPSSHKLVSPHLDHEPNGEDSPPHPHLHFAGVSTATYGHDEKAQVIHDNDTLLRRTSRASGVRKTHCGTAPDTLRQQPLLQQYTPKSSITAAQHYLTEIKASNGTVSSLSKLISTNSTQNNKSNSTGDGGIIEVDFQPHLGDTTICPPPLHVCIVEDPDQEVIQQSVMILLKPLTKLAKASIAAATSVESKEVRSRVLATDLVLAIVKELGPDKVMSNSFYSNMKHHILSAVIMNLCTTVPTSLFTLSLQLFENVVVNMWKHYNEEVAVYISRIILDVLLIDCSSFRQKIAVLQFIGNIFGNKWITLDLFLNSDCCPNSVPVIDKILQALMLSIHSNHEVKHWITESQHCIIIHSCVQCITTLLNTLYTLLDSLDVTFDDPLDAIHASPNREKMQLALIGMTWRIKGTTDAYKLLKKFFPDAQSNPKLMGTVLRQIPCLHKMYFGEWITKANNADFFEAYVDTFNFRNQAVDVAVHQLYGRFGLLESEVINRTMPYFARKYNRDHGNSFTFDTLEFVSSALFLISASLRTEKEQFSKSEFIRIVMDEERKQIEATDPENRKNPKFSGQYLSDMYNRIKNDWVTEERDPIGPYVPPYHAYVAALQDKQTAPLQNTGMTVTGGGGADNNTKPISSCMIEPVIEIDQQTAQGKLFGDKQNRQVRFLKHLKDTIFDAVAYSKVYKPDKWVPCIANVLNVLHANNEWRPLPVKTPPANPARRVINYIHETTQQRKPLIQDTPPTLQPLQPLQSQHQHRLTTTTTHAATIEHSGVIPQLRIGRISIGSPLSDLHVVWNTTHTNDSLNEYNDPTPTKCRDASAMPTVTLFDAGSSTYTTKAVVITEEYHHHHYQKREGMIGTTGLSGSGSKLTPDFLTPAYKCHHNEKSDCDDVFVNYQSGCSNSSNNESPTSQVSPGGCSLTFSQSYSCLSACQQPTLSCAELCCIMYLIVPYLHSTLFTPFATEMTHATTSLMTECFHLRDRICSKLGIDVKECIENKQTATLRELVGNHQKQCSVNGMGGAGVLGSPNHAKKKKRGTNTGGHVTHNNIGPVQLIDPVLTAHNTGCDLAWFELRQLQSIKELQEYKADLMEEVMKGEPIECLSPNTPFCT